ncbi:hypothetical protein EJ02DRAFT_358744 [Clathrospora elynae]|uniref:DUF7730 domain-containing protein n=1 Tax=Clathrospora elynae TaxID=706981 RepID=A0A6A5S9W2_9PLEO|nr:hypothetical protein EJ02DRAFT_358744 [Clathrospora elynae]
MKRKGKLFGLLPGARWIPHDIPSQEASSSKAKSRNPFSLKSSAPDRTSHGARNSTISLTSQPDAKVDARTHAQGQSMFFARLPIELRRMVYEYVVGSATVHLTLSTKRRFGHFVCDTAEGGGEEEERECGCRVLVGGRKNGAKLDGAAGCVVRVCRRMYSEAISHLYRPHSFSLLHMTHLLYLPSSLPQPRLNSIRTLRLRWAIRALPYLRRGATNRIAYREDTENWERVWAILASMQGLKSLYVVLVDPSPQHMWERTWLELEEQLLQSVKHVTRPNVFELMLPYASCGTKWNMGQSRVVLTKPDGGSVEEEEGQA